MLVLSGRGGTELTLDELAAAEAETPGWTWTVLGAPGDRWVADPWPLICAADVVVTHAGQNAIADVAAARRPAVVVPQPRPFDEQATTAGALAAAGLAVVCARWPAGPWLKRSNERPGGQRRLGAVEPAGAATALPRCFGTCCAPRT